MNKKIVTLILVILISFCFLSIVVADNATHDDNNASDQDNTINKNKTIDNDKVDKNKTIDNDKVDKNKITDKKNTPDINETDDKPKKSYILAMGNENDITFSDGFRGFILDYSKSPASSGDEFERVSTSYAPNSNTLKLAIIECYKQDSSAQIGGIMADFVKTGSSSTRVGEAVAASNEKVSDCESVKINNNTEAVFEFEVLKSVSGNESDYFAYRVSFRTIDGGEDINQTNGVTNAPTTSAPNANNTTNTANMTQPNNNGTNATFLDSLYDYLTSLVNSFYDSWKPFIDTIINGFLMFINTLGGLVKLFEDFIMEIRNLIDILGKLLKMLGSIWGTLKGILKLLGMILTAILQLINLIEYIFNFIVGLIYTIISLLEQIVGLLSYLIDFIIDIINQIMSLIQAVWEFFKSSGSFFGKVIENAVAIITSFVIITIGAFVYNRIR